MELQLIFVLLLRSLLSDLSSEHLTNPSGTASPGKVGNLADDVTVNDAIELFYIEKLFALSRVEQKHKGNLISLL